MKFIAAPILRLNGTARAAQEVPVEMEQRVCHGVPPAAALRARPASAVVLAWIR
jgi:hypothetical protein